jgi:hypothetical protein|nr:MAG TPA: hypothetical protein [Caudoviricetes sp.]
MTNTIAKTDNTGKRKRQMKDQKEKMSASEHGIFSLSERQRPKQKIGRENIYILSCFIC